MPTTKQIGEFGESVAVEYLERSGYEILCRNFKTSSGEIDIIALSPDEVCAFIEVKTRKGTAFGLACEAVGKRKQAHIIRTAMSYHCNYDMRFDIIEVYYSGYPEFKIENINHIENAFENIF